VGREPPAALWYDNAKVATRILVLGDNTAGRHIGTALAADSAFECLLGGHEPEQLRPFADQIGVDVVGVNDADAVSLARAFNEVFAVVNTLGPFAPGSYAVAQRCAACGVHYVDVASTPQYVSGVSALNRRAKATGSLIVTGASVVPAVSAALVDYLATEFDRLGEIHTAVAPLDNGNGWRDGARSVQTLAGYPMRIKQDGRWRVTFGWSEPVRVDFPAPIGRRRMYLCDVADLVLFPQRYGARTVTFRAGLARPLLNYGAALVSRFTRRRRTAEPEPKETTAASIGLQELLASTIGIRVAVRGLRNGEQITRAVTLISRDRGVGAIACSPVLALLRKWVREGVVDPGARPCIDLLGLDAIKAELMDRDVVLVRS
jgi:saccharopine dehydrogenase-like NADP-dependent oxidoreductase